MTTPLGRSALRCHPQTPCIVLDEIVAELRVDAGSLEVTYRMRGDLARLRIPSQPLDPDRLWEHTCCELFVAPHGGDAYVEHNFSPNGQVARFEFSRYRERVTSPATDARASIACTRENDALVLCARVPFDATPARIAITTVVEDEHGTLSYWALRHPEGRPDFHHPVGFALSLTLGAVPAIVDAPP